MKLKTIINNLEKKRLEYIRKHGYEPVVFDFEADCFEGELIISLTKGKQRVEYGIQATTPCDDVYIKWVR